MTNRVVVRDPGTSPSAAKRLVESCARNELAAFESDVFDGFVAVRRLRLRLVSKGGLPSRHALTKAWRTALRKALRAELDSAGSGVGENVVRWPSDERARVEWLLRWTSRESRVWWSDAVAATIGVSAPLEPAHILLKWARDEPESLPLRVIRLGVEHPAFQSMSRDDLEQVWQVYSSSVRARSLAMARAPAAESVDIEQVAGFLRKALRSGSEQQHLALFFARMSLRVTSPSTSPGAVDQVLGDLVEQAGNVVEDAPMATEKPAAESLTSEVVATEDADTSQPGSAATAADPARSGGLRESFVDAQNVAEPKVWEHAGQALLIHPLLKEAHRRRTAGDDFATEWNRLVHTIFWRTHGPRRDQVRRALEAGAPIAAWFAAEPDSDWLDEPRATDLEWLDSLCATLPEEWGTCEERWPNLVKRTAVISAEIPFVDVTFPMRAVDIEIRKRGWDIDPGWLPELNRVLRFHYRESSR